RHQAAPPRCLWINSSSRALGQGVTLCEQEDAARGMLWLARGLEITPDEDADLQQVLRINLAGWRRQVHPLRAAFSFQGQEVVEVVAFSRDGGIVLTGSKRGPAHLWEPATGKPVGQPLRHRGQIFGAAFSPDGQVVVTCSRDNPAQLWEVTTGEPLGEPMR